MQTELNFERKKSFSERFRAYGVLTFAPFHNQPVFLTKKLLLRCSTLWLELVNFMLKKGVHKTEIISNILQCQQNRWKSRNKHIFAGNCDATGNSEKYQ